MKIKIDKIILFSFCITLIGNALDYLHIKISTGLTYSIMLLPIIVSFVIILYLILTKRLVNTKFKYLFEMKWGILVFIVFLIISTIKSIQTDMFTWGTIGESIRLLVPFIYVFIIINFLSNAEIEFFMRFCLLVATLCFLITTDYSNLTMSNILSISFSNSYSPFENFEVSLLSWATSIYFIYNYRKNKIWCLLSVVLVFLTFKRVFIISTIILIICVFFKFTTKKINGLILVLSSLFWIMASEFYLYLLKPANYFWTMNTLHFDVVNFSMSRAYRVWYLFQNGFESYGLGSTTQYLTKAFNLGLTGKSLGVTLELDLIKILMELGILGVTIFVISYFEITRKNLYSYFVISLLFLQLLMANGLTRYLEFSIILTTIALIHYRFNSEKDAKTVKMK